MMEQKPVLSRGVIILALVAVIALSQIFVGWLILYRIEHPAAAEATPTPTPTITPEPTPEFNNDISAGLSIIYALSDDDPSNDEITKSFSRNNFLKALVSQLGSSGEIISAAMSTFDYYTEWYIGGYEGKTGWSKDTPWCASYVSWCLNQVSLSVKGSVPRYANVDLFMEHFYDDTWLTADTSPTPGDLVFFGYFGNPNHMGVVIGVEENAIYTIEGNTADVVGIRKYARSDESILGYGVINWAS